MSWTLWERLVCLGEPASEQPLRTVSWTVSRAVSWVVSRVMSWTCCCCWWHRRRVLLFFLLSLRQLEEKFASSRATFFSRSKHVCLLGVFVPLQAADCPAPVVYPGWFINSKLLRFRSDWTAKVLESHSYCPGRSRWRSERSCHAISSHLK